MSSRTTSRTTTTTTKSFSEPLSGTGTTRPVGRQDTNYEDDVGGAHYCTVQQSSSSSLSSPSSQTPPTLQPSSSSLPPPITVILFCGLPASGKSTLAKCLQRQLLLSSSSAYDVHLIEYDELEEQQLQQLLLTMKPSSLLRGVQTQKSDTRILTPDTEIDELFTAQQEEDGYDDKYIIDNEDGDKNSMKGGGIGADGDSVNDTSKSNSGSDIRRQAWKRAREIAVRRLEQIINKYYHTYYCEHMSDATAENSNDGDDDDNICGRDFISSQQQRRHRRTIILMDDNFHLRGMRKQIHRFLYRYKSKETPSRINEEMAIPIQSPVEASGSSTSRHVDFNFGIIWVESSVESCIERNYHRRLSPSSEKQNRDVPTNQVITKMNDVFEPPRTVWESNHIIVKTEEIMVTDTSKKQDDIGIYANEECLTRIASFVVECPKIIDIPNDDEVDEETNRDKESARQTTRQSQVHNLDQTLRTWVGTVAKFDKALARPANDGRKIILQESRLFSTSMTTDSHQQECSMSTRKFTDVDDIKKRFVDLVIPIDSQLSSVRSNIFELLE